MVERRGFQPDDAIQGISFLKNILSHCPSVGVVVDLFISCYVDLSCVSVCLPTRSF
jgi:hypothetical protein